MRRHVPNPPHPPNSPARSHPSWNPPARSHFGCRHHRTHTLSDPRCAALPRAAAGNGSTWLCSMQCSQSALSSRRWSLPHRCTTCGAPSTRERANSRVPLSPRPSPLSPRPSALAPQPSPLSPRTRACPLSLSPRPSALAAVLPFSAEPTIASPPSPYVSRLCCRCCPTRHHQMQRPTRRPQRPMAQSSLRSHPLPRMEPRRPVGSSHGVARTHIYGCHIYGCLPRERCESCIPSYAHAHVHTPTYTHPHTHTHAHIDMLT